MIKREELVEGMFVWWTAHRYSKDWSVPCKIVKGPYKKDENEEWEFVDLLSLDDMKITTLAAAGEAVREEISPTTIDKVKSYLVNRKLEFKHGIINAEANVEKAKLAVEIAKEKVVEFEATMAEILS